MDLDRPVQDDVHRFTRLFDGQDIAPGLEYPAMSALGHPVQLRGSQPSEQLKIGQQISDVVFVL
jgi:hypothetical protein